MGADLQFILTWVKDIVSSLGPEIFITVAVVTLVGYLLGRG